MRIGMVALLLVTSCFDGVICVFVRRTIFEVGPDVFVYLRVSVTFARTLAFENDVFT
jgi:hypothetical protein